MTYTPTTEDVIGCWARSAEQSGRDSFEAEQEARRWLAEHDREVKTQALEETAEDFGDTTWVDVFLEVTNDVEGAQAVIAWLRDRAQQLRSKHDHTTRTTRQTARLAPAGHRRRRRNHH